MQTQNTRNTRDIIEFAKALPFEEPANTMSNCHINSAKQKKNSRYFLTTAYLIHLFTFAYVYRVQGSHATE